MPLQNINSQFTEAKNKKVKSDARYSHNVHRGTLNGSEKQWIKKEMKSPEVARTEFLAQDFFRLIIPHQPETRLLSDATNVHYILTEEAPGYRSLPQDQHDKFANGEYTGLGQALIVSMYLQEIDLKNGNIGLDENNRVIKIDGDWCFASIRESKSLNQERFKITEKDIASLPRPPDAYVFNWLDYVKGETFHEESQIVSNELKNSPVFRNELNEAILKISILPDEYIDQFVDKYIPAGAERYATLLKERKSMLLMAAVKNTSFKEYVENINQQEFLENLFGHISSMTGNGEPIISDDNEEMIKKIKDKMQYRIANIFQIGEAMESEIATKKIELNQKLADYLLLIPHRYSKEEQWGKMSLPNQLSLELNKANTPQRIYEIDIQVNKMLISSDVYHLIDQLDKTPNHYNKKKIDEFIDKIFSKIEPPAKPSREELSSYVEQVKTVLARFESEEDKLTNDIHSILENINEQRVGAEDPLIDQYVNDIKEKLLAEPRMTTAELQTLKKEVTSTYEDVSSPQVKAVKEVIQNYRRNSGLFTVGMEAKAQRIEDALRETPLNLRKAVITSEGAANAVQEALASHRYLGVRGNVYKKSNNEINTEKAANTFKRLKHQFSEVIKNEDYEESKNEGLGNEGLGTVHGSNLKK